MTTEGVFETVDGWLANFEVNMNEDIARIQRLKRRIVSLEEVYMHIGLLTALRVSHDSSYRNLSSSVKTYPLNQSQISIFTEEVLKLVREKGQGTAGELETYLTDRVVLFVNARERMLFGSDIGKFHTQVGMGLKFIIN